MVLVAILLGDPHVAEHQGGVDGQCAQDLSELGESALAVRLPAVLASLALAFLLRGLVRELGGDGYQAGVEARFREAVALLQGLGVFDGMIRLGLLWGLADSSGENH